MQNWVGLDSILITHVKHTCTYMLIKHDVTHIRLKGWTRERGIDKGKERKG